MLFCLLDAVCIGSRIHIVECDGPDRVSHQIRSWKQRDSIRTCAASYQHHRGDTAVLPLLYFKVKFSTAICFFGSGYGTGTAVYLEGTFLFLKKADR